MQTPEELYEALKAFSAKPSLSQTVDDYFTHVSRTGIPLFNWDVIRPAFLMKLETTMNEMNNGCPFEHLSPVPNVEYCDAQTIIERVMDAARKLDGIPFTIQRLCELLSVPGKTYSRADKYFRAVEKNISVVTTVDTKGNRETGAPVLVDSSSGCEDEQMEWNETDDQVGCGSEETEEKISNGPSADQHMPPTVSEIATESCSVPLPSFNNLKSSYTTATTPLLSLETSESSIVVTTHVDGIDNLSPSITSSWFGNSSSSSPTGSSFTTMMPVDISQNSSFEPSVSLPSLEVAFSSHSNSTVSNSDLYTDNQISISIGESASVAEDENQNGAKSAKIEDSTDQTSSTPDENAVSKFTNLPEPEEASYRQTIVREPDEDDDKEEEHEICESELTIRVASVSTKAITVEIVPTSDDVLNGDVVPVEEGNNSDELDSPPSKRQRKRWDVPPAESDERS